MTGIRPPDPTRRTRRSRRLPGRLVIVIGAVLVVAVSAYVMVRIVQTSGPRPPASEIPQRPDRSGAP